MEEKAIMGKRINPKYAIELYCGSDEIKELLEL